MSRGKTAGKSNVLLIHGDGTSRAVYANALKSAGFDVVTVSNGHGATELAVAAQAAVVVTTVSPGGAIDGF